MRNSIATTFTAWTKPSNTLSMKATEGGYYGWHVDMGEKNYEPRKISLSLQLSEPSRL